MNPKRYDAEKMARLKAQYGNRWFLYYSEDLFQSKDLSEGKQSRIEPVKEVRRYITDELDAIDCNLSYNRLLNNGVLK